MNIRMYDSKAYFCANDAFLKARMPPRKQAGLAYSSYSRYDSEFYVCTSS